MNAVNSPTRSVIRRPSCSNLFGPLDVSYSHRQGKSSGFRAMAAEVPAMLQIRSSPVGSQQSHLTFAEGRAQPATIDSMLLIALKNVEKEIKASFCQNEVELTGQNILSMVY
jgi:hypothetical protein